MRLNHEMISEMQKALEHSINYIKKEGSNRIILKNGIYQKQKTGFHTYIFEAERLFGLDFDIEYEIQIKSSRTQAKIERIDENAVSLIFYEDLGESIPYAILFNSNYYLLEKLKEKLEKVKSGKIELTNLNEKLFDLTSSVINNEFDEIEDNIFEIVPKCNKNQKKAIIRALNNEILFIWGPPGAGKSEVIGKLIKLLIDNKMSILVLSHTNLATDNAVQRVYKYLKDDPLISDGKIFRFGNSNSEFIEKFKELHFDYIKDVRNEETNLRLNEIIGKISILTDKNNQMLKNKEKIKSITLIKSEISEKKNEIEEVVYKIERRKENVINDRNKVDKISCKIEKMMKKNKFEKFIIQYKPQKDEQVMSSLLLKINEYEHEIVKLQDYNETKKVELHSEEKKMSELIKSIGYDSEEQIVEIIVSNEKMIDLLLEEKQELKKHIDEIDALLINEARVIATTLTKSYLSEKILSRKYDCIIVDEASMAPLPAVWFASGLANKKVIIIGDFLQLPPIANFNGNKKEEVDCVDKWLRRDIFEVSKIVNRVNEGLEHNALVQLNVQHRMHPHIAELVNELVYAEIGKGKYKLENGEMQFDTKMMAKLPMEGYRLGIYDTGKVNIRTLKDDNNSYYNGYNAILAIELAKQAIKSGFKSVGIITPFRAQANLIAKMLADECLEPDLIEANTVHKFQGKEKDIIIFDIVCSERTQMLDDLHEGGNDAKLINVAFSRAKEKCLMICDVDLVMEKHSESSLIRKAIEFNKKKRIPIISAERVVKNYYNTDNAEKVLEKLSLSKDVLKEIEDSNFVNEKDFYTKFIKDILFAEKEIVIDSPYMTKDRVAALIPYFKIALSKKVKIFIITRITSDHDGAMKFAAENETVRLHEMGIIILPFMGKIHEKFAVIDRKISWFGSLNILSQKESREMMFKCEGEGMAKVLLNFINFIKNVGEIGELRIESCKWCNAIGSYYWNGPGIHGFWTHCLTGNHAKDKQPKTKEEIKAKKEHIKKIRVMKKKTSENGFPICPDCGIEMVKRKGKFGEFYGCPNYPKCRATE